MNKIKHLLLLPFLWSFVYCANFNQDEILPNNQANLAPTERELQARQVNPELLVPVDFEGVQIIGEMQNNLRIVVNDRHDYMHNFFRFFNQFQFIPYFNIMVFFEVVIRNFFGPYFRIPINDQQRNNDFINRLDAPNQRVFPPLNQMREFFAVENENVFFNIGQANQDNGYQEIENCCRLFCMACCFGVIDYLIDEAIRSRPCTFCYSACMICSCIYCEEFCYRNCPNYCFNGCRPCFECVANCIYECLCVCWFC